jgi:hypothetical protein
VATSLSCHVGKASSICSRCCSHTRNQARAHTHTLTSANDGALRHVRTVTHEAVFPVFCCRSCLRKRKRQRET